RGRSFPHLFPPCAPQGRCPSVEPSRRGGPRMIVEGNALAGELRRRRLGRAALHSSLTRTASSAWVPGERLAEAPSELLMLTAIRSPPTSWLRHRSHVMGPRFRDRVEGGRLLGEHLRGLGIDGGAIVLGIPRGGVATAAEVARVLDLPLDVALARKVGAPGNAELAIGAVGPDGSAVIDEDLARRVGATEEWLARAVEREQREVADRLRRFRGDRLPLNV